MEFTVRFWIGDNANQFTTECEQYQILIDSNHCSMVNAALLPQNFLLRRINTLDTCVTGILPTVDCKQQTALFDRSGVLSC